jgi:Protein SCAI
LASAAVTEGEKAIKHLGYSAGITTSQRKTNEKGVVDGVNSTGLAGGLYPGDLIPFTRKPMFLIVDSNNSLAFKVSILTQGVLNQRKYLETD